MIPHSCGFKIMNKNDSAHDIRFYPGSKTVAILTCPFCGSSLNVFVSENEFRKATFEELKKCIEDDFKNET